MNRKREAPPALFLLSNIRGIPAAKYCAIYLPKFLIGRCATANLSRVQRNISRKECTLSYNATTKKWSMESHSRNAIHVQGKTIKANDSITLQCGDKIKFAANIIYEFKCSPNGDRKCCTDFKRARLSDGDDEESKDKDVASVSNVNDVEDDIFSPLIVNNRKSDAPPDNSLVLPSTLPISQLPDSNEFRNSPEDDLSFSVPNITEVTESYSYAGSKPASLLDVDSFLESSSNVDIKLSDNINELEAQIHNYGNNDQFGLDGKTSIDQELKKELNYGLEYIRKLTEMNFSCEAYFSNPSDVDALNSIKELSSYFQKKCSKLNYVNEKTFYNKPDENLYRIILNMNTILKKEMQLAMGFLPQFLELTSNKELVKDCQNKHNLLDNISSDCNPQSSHNRDEQEQNNLKTEISNC